jgi:hypothetical protein
VPIQKYAAQFIMRDEDTIIRWKAADKDFADRVKRAEAEYIRKKLLETKAEFALERLFKQAFTYAQAVEIKQAEPVPIAGTGTTTQLRERFIQMVKAEKRPFCKRKVSCGDPCGIADFVLFRSAMLEASFCAWSRFTAPASRVPFSKRITKVKAPT